MALTLAESAKLSTNDLQRGVVETFVKTGVVLDRIPLKGIEGNAFQYNEEATLPGVEFRAVNAAYSESTGTFNPKTEGLVILGGDADVDTFIEQTRSNLADQRAEQDKLKVKAANIKYTDTFFNGDTAVDANAFDGLKKRLTGSQVIDAGAADGLGIIAGGHDFLDELDALIDAVDGADVLYMNAIAKGRLRSLARRLGFHEADRDEFGRKVDYYNGVAFVDPGRDAAGDLIIPNDEVQGASNDATSIYAVRFGEDESDGGVTGLTNGGVQVRDLGEIDAKPVKRTRIEFFCGLAVFGLGAARLRGVRASA